jgi:hypothetical protein
MAKILMHADRNERPCDFEHDALTTSVCPSVNFYIFDFSRTTGPILTKLGTNHPWSKGIQFYSNEGDSPSPRGDNSLRVNLHRIFCKNLLQNQQAKFNLGKNYSLG